MAKSGHQTVICNRIIPGRIDPVALHNLYPERYPFLLASTADSTDNPDRARYDILLAFPQASLSLSQQGELLTDGLDVSGNDFLDGLDQCWRAARTTQTNSSDWPFSGGWFLYLGYELAGQIEPVLQLKQDQDSALPVASATRIPAAVLIDHQTNETILLAETSYETCLEQMQSDIQQLTVAPAVPDYDILLEEEKPTIYLDGVSRIKQYIVDGDVFQVNLSRQWQGPLPEGIKPAQLYQQLAHNNPAPFAGYAKLGESAVISSSPERLVRTKGAHIETRPIAGTRPRSNITGAGNGSDEAMLAELIGHPKERAEHIMLIDLERNDLGRVCQPGSIRVSELMTLESYAHVHHIVSNVEGKLADATTPGQIIRAVFPGGTITGCPKVRCMAIIAELETGPRGAYTGSMGYLNHNGDMDLNILIRTIVLDQGQIKIRAGAGLVADSIAERELDETRAKARGMLLAMQNRNQTVASAS